MTKKITITEGLVELKLYDKRIKKAIDEGSYVDAVKKSSKQVNHNTREFASSSMMGQYQSVTDLIKNRNALKAAIVQSNAMTKVVIGGCEMTVAEAIERKTSIIYEKHLLEELRSQYLLAKDTCDSENKKVQLQVDKLIEKIAEKDSKSKDLNEEQILISNTYKEANEFELFDPLKIVDKIDALSRDIETFESNVDTALALSNATTFIEVNV